MGQASRGDIGNLLWVTARREDGALSLSSHPPGRSTRARWESAGRCFRAAITMSCRCIDGEEQRMASRIRFAGTGPGALTQDGCAVELYRRLPADGEAEIVAAAVPAGGSILELGSGRAAVTHALVGLGYAVTAVDNSAEILAISAARGDGAGGYRGSRSRPRLRRGAAGQHPDQLPRQGNARRPARHLPAPRPARRRRADRAAQSRHQRDAAAGATPERKLASATSIESVRHEDRLSHTSSCARRRPMRCGRRATPAS